MRTKTLIKHEDRKLLQSYNNFIGPFRQWGIAGFTRGFSGRLTMISRRVNKKPARFMDRFLSYSCKQPGYSGTTSNSTSVLLPLPKSMAAL
jgi:hypothetical protein